MSAVLERVITPPPHVISAFGLNAELEVPSESGSFHYGDIVLTLAGDTARAGWSARIRESLCPAGFRVARPVQTSDGRYIISGWRADSSLEGNPQPRWDELVAASLRLQQSLEKLPRPRFLAGPVPLPLLDSNVYVVADRAAWDSDPARYLSKAALWPGESILSDSDLKVHDLFFSLCGQRREVVQPPQIVHGEMLGTIVFHGSLDPGVRDLVPYWRPAVWGTALVVVDALVWGDADPGLPGRWAHLPEFPQLMLRALLFRLAVHLLHPGAIDTTSQSLERAVEVISPFL